MEKHPSETLWELFSTQVPFSSSSRGEQHTPLSSVKWGSWYQLQWWIV